MVEDGSVKIVCFAKGVGIPFGPFFMKHAASLSNLLLKHPNIARN